MFDSRIEFQDQLVLKHRDIEQLNLLIRQLSESVMATSQTELELGVKTRHIDRLTYSVKMAENKAEKLSRYVQQLEKENNR